MGINIGAFVAPLIAGWLAQSDELPRLPRALASTQHVLALGFGAAAVGMSSAWSSTVLGWKNLVAGRGRGPSGRATQVAAAQRADRQVRRVGPRRGARPRVASRPSPRCVVTPSAEAIARNSKWVLLASPWRSSPGCSSRRVDARGAEAAGGRWRSCSWPPRSSGWPTSRQARPSTCSPSGASTTGSRPRLSGQLVPGADAVLHHHAGAGVRRAVGAPGPARPLEPGQVRHRRSGCSASALRVMVGAASAAAGGVRVSPMWLVLSYLLQTTGELCLSPVGMSAMSKLAPARIAGLTMGVWFLASRWATTWRAWRRASTRRCRCRRSSARHGHRPGGRGDSRAAGQADPTDAGALRA